MGSGVNQKPLASEDVKYCVISLVPNYFCVRHSNVQTEICVVFISINMFFSYKLITFSNLRSVSYQLKVKERFFILNWCRSSKTIRNVLFVNFSKQVAILNDFYMHLNINNTLINNWFIYIFHSPIWWIKWL